MKASIRNLATFGIGAAALGLGACSSGGGDGADLSADATGQLSLAITDAPVDSVESINVYFTGVRLKPQGGPALDIPVLDADGQPAMIDMLTLTNGTYEDLFVDAEVPAGVYNWIELQVLADPSSSTDSYVRAMDGGEYELRIPSSEQNGLRFVSPFTVTADQQTHLLLDWDMRMALIQPPGQGGTYMLRPAFRLIDLTEYGTLTGSVLDTLFDGAMCLGNSTPNAGNSVYIYRAADLVGPDGVELAPGDLGSTTDPAPVATGIVELGANGSYTFEIILSPGEYRAAYTCDGEADGVESDDDILLVLSPDTLVIEHGATAVVEFLVSP